LPVVGLPQVDHSSGNCSDIKSEDKGIVVSSEYIILFMTDCFFSHYLRNQRGSDSFSIRLGANRQASLFCRKIIWKFCHSGMNLHFGHFNVSRFFTNDFVHDDDVMSLLLLILLLLILRLLMSLCIMISIVLSYLSNKKSATTAPRHE
jgi:hypothetical protein